MLTHLTRSHLPLPLPKYQYPRSILTLTHTPIGLLFTHWTADSLTLWKQPVTDEHLWTAASYYNALTKISPYTASFVSAVVVLGAAALLWSLRDGEAVNVMFDGASTCASRAPAAPPVRAAF